MATLSTTENAKSRLFDGDTFKAENPDQSRIVVKGGDQFLVLNQNGLIPSQTSKSPFGLYRNDTRHLSLWDLFANGAPLRLLSAKAGAGYKAEFVYGNQTSQGMQEQSVMVKRELVISRAIHERLTVKNYNPNSVSLELAILFGADFADIFEVRGTNRSERGTANRIKIVSLKGPLPGSRIKLGYVGLDGLQIETIIELRSRVKVLPNEDGLIRVPLVLEPGQEEKIEVSISSFVARNNARLKGFVPFELAEKRANRDYSRWLKQRASIETGNKELNMLIDQAFRDLYVLKQEIPGGTAIAAGLPWFACTFGRDQAISAMQILPFNPDIARSVLLNLANYQGTKHDPYREEEPGKIMHELRLGEMARTREIPFSPYYGTVDATSLWLMLLTKYVNWTKDKTIVKDLWDKIKAAVSYLESELKSSQNGYLSYGAKSKTTALSNQGWKDSFDSVMYSDGLLAKAPIALVEVQGYLYAALTGTASLAYDSGEFELASHLNCLAKDLKERFYKDFWMEDEDYPALALDGDGKQCDVVSSNAGHLLGTGILSPEMENRIVVRLNDPDLFSTWGVRTLGQNEHSYNPMSYHNGSVWPHDNAMIAMGMGASLHHSEGFRILLALIKLSTFQSDSRLPELVCGFDDNQNEGPTSYPVSCSPQAWAAGAPLQVLFSCLSISVDTETSTLRISNPSIPEWLGGVTIRGLRILNGRLDLHFENKNGKTLCRVSSKSRTLKVEIVCDQ